MGWAKNEMFEKAPTHLRQEEGRKKKGSSETQAVRKVRSREGKRGGII